jgi:RHS repeat-associated protein
MSKEQQINQITYLKHQNQQAYLVYCQKIITYLTVLNWLKTMYMVKESTIYNEKGTSEAEILSTEPHQEIDDVKPLKHKEKPNLKTGLASESLYYQKDKDTGLYYANARYYDSETARFLREDPQDGNTSEPPSLHRYLYANANPTLFIDPTGEAAYLFDGTGQDSNNQFQAQSNIGKLRGLIGGKRTYIEGIGTNDGFFSNAFGNVTGAGVNRRLNKAYVALVNNFNGLSKDGESTSVDRTIDLFGFSRGAATARAFANLINERGIPDLSSAREQLVYRSDGSVTKETVYDNYFKPEIRFMGLFDTVGSFGIPGDATEGGLDLSIAPNVKNVRHAVARDEKRDSFPLSSAIDPTNVQDPRIVEKIFPGVHSDIGGGYPDDDSLANDALYWMYQEAARLGVPVSGYPDNLFPVQPEEVEKLPKFDTVQQAFAAIYLGEAKRINKPQQGNRTLHDSRFNINNSSPRNVIFRANKRVQGSDVPAWRFEPILITSPQYEEFMRTNFDKPFWIVTEDVEKP